VAAAGSLKITVEPVPMAGIESAWNGVEKGRRIIFLSEFKTIAQHAYSFALDPGTFFRGPGV
jgi:hypothetical protein